MTPERWHEITAIFHAALARKPSERETFLAEACRMDAMLRSDVDAMLAGHEGAGQFGEVPLSTSVSQLQPGSVPGVATLAIGSFLGPYRILSPLGAGGMGQVYKAVDPRLHRDVAIKVLPAVFTTDSDRLARFEREARVLAALNHPHIGAIYGLEETEGIRGLVLELVEGATLADRLKGGPVPVAEAVSFGEQVAEALEAAHSKGIIHRDLKPANVKVTPEGQVKVLDFGLAKAVLGTEEHQDLSQVSNVKGLVSLAGQIVGTPPYMSPEQARGRAVDEQTDIWAFGCLLYELLTGKRAFQGESSSDTIMAVLEREPDWSALPAKTPARIRELLRQCLQKDGKRRLPNIADARRTMLAAAAAERPPAQERSTYRWALRAVAALTLVVVAVLGWRLRARGEAPGKSIAVLPFASLSAGEDNAYFAEGIHGELLNRLSQIADLKVISHTSVQQYKTGTRNLREIGKQLGVEAILEGSVQRAGNRVRIEVQLVDARKDHQLWADRYDRDLSDIFQIQSAVAEEIANKLHARLSPSERSTLERKPTQSREAWDLYLHGEAMRVYVGDLPGAEKLFRKAIEVDAGFALAFAQLSRVLNDEWFHGVVPDTARRIEWLAFAEKARELQPDLPEAHLALGLDFYHATRDYAAAEHEFRLALASVPGCAECIGQIGLLERRQGRWNDALASFARSLDLDPRNQDMLGTYAETLESMRRYADALAAIDRSARVSAHPEEEVWSRRWIEYLMGGSVRPVLDVLAKMPPGRDSQGDVIFTRWRIAMTERRFDDAIAVLHSTSLEMMVPFFAKADLRGLALAAAGRKAEARAAFEEARAVYEKLLRVRRDDALALILLARVDANLGRVELGHQEAAQASALLPETKDAILGVVVSCIRTQILIVSGELDAALAETERLATVNNGYTRAELEMPMFDPLRPHPRFQQVLARLRGR